MPWVFVYGTLMRGMLNHDLIKDYMLQCLKATSTGRLFHLPEGYPMLVDDERKIVYGEAVKIYDDTSALSILDELEAFFGPGHTDNLYERVERDIQLPDLAWKVRALIYICPEHRKEQIFQTGTLVTHGDWKKHIKPSNK